MKHNRIYVLSFIIGIILTTIALWPRKQTISIEQTHVRGMNDEDIKRMLDAVRVKLERDAAKYDTVVVPGW